MKRGVDVDLVDRVKKAKQGDKQALVGLIMAEKQDYYKLAYVYLGNTEDCLDAMGEMIVILYENIGGLKKEEAFYSWSKTILVNCCKKILRNRKKVIVLNQVEEAIYKERFGQREDRLLLEDHLSRIGPKHQEVLKLRYFLDLDYETIGDILKIPLGTVKSRISLGLKKLKESFGGELNGQS
jgi:RNA polymerase sigma factor (sigma-70 family)